MNHQGVAVSMVFPILKTIVHKGYDKEEFFNRVAFDTALLQDPDARIEAKELKRLMMAAADFTQDDHFGLHQGELMEFADLGVLGYVMMHSRTVADMLAAYEKYNEIVCNGFRLNRETAGDDVLIRMFMHDPESVSRHCVEDMASSLYRLIGYASNRRIPLKEIRFTHGAPADTEPYKSVFGRVPEFGSEENVLRMDKNVLHSPVMYSDSRLLHMFDSMAKEMVDKLTRTNEFSKQVIEWIKTCMPTFFPTLEQTSESFGISPRTIQYKLKKENTSYHALSVHVRKELAVSYLRKSAVSIAEIAYVLHFSEPSAFQTAFKKWTGLTPRQYRDKVRNEHSTNRI